VPQPGSGEFGVHLRHPVGALGLLVHLGDLRDQPLVDALTLGLCAATVLVVGGPGDLYQLTLTLEPKTRCPRSYHEA